MLGSLRLSIFTLEKISCSLTYIIPVLSTLKAKITQQSEPNLQLFQALDCVLFVLKRSEQDFPTFFLENSEALKTFLQEILLDVFRPKNRIFLQKIESPLYGKFLNYYQYFIWILLGFSSSLYAALPKNAQLQEMIYRHFLKDINIKNLRPFVLEQYYNLAQSLTLDNQKLLEDFSGRLTLSSQIDLEKAIINKDKANHTSIELYMDLSRSLKILFSIHLNLKKNTITETEALFNTYLRTIPKAEPSDLDQLNHIGAFLLGLTFLENSSAIKQISKTFIEDFLIFLKIQPTVTKEALVFLDNDLWKTFSKTESLPHQNSTLLKILTKYQDLSGQCGCTLLRFTELTSLLKIKKIQQNILTYLTDSFSQINQNLQTLWDQFPADHKFERLLTIECNKLTFFLIPLFKSVLTSPFNREALTHQSQWHNFKDLIRQVAQLYFQPALVFLAKDYEKHYIYFQTSKALKESEKIRILALLNFAEILKDLSKQLRSQFPSSGPLQQKIWIDFLSHIRFSEQSMTITPNASFDHQPKAMLAFYTFIFGLTRIPDILSKINGFSVEDYQSSELTIEIKELLTHHLKPFLLQAASLFSPSLPASKQVFQKIINGFSSVLSCPSNYPANDSLYIEFFTNLLYDASISQINADASTDFIYCFIRSCFDTMNTDLVKKISFSALSDLELWKFFFKQLSSFVLKDQRAMITSEKTQYFSGFVEAVLKRVENMADFEEIIKIQPESSRRRSLQIFVKNLYNLLAQEIEDFPFTDLLCLANKALNSIFAKLLSVFEIIFIYLQSCSSRNQSKSNNKYAEMLIARLKEAKNEQIEDGFLVSISQRFYSNLSNLVLIHPFKKIKSLNPVKSEEAQLVSFSTLKNSLIAYCHCKPEPFFKPFHLSSSPEANRILTIQTYLELLETLISNYSSIQFDLDQSFIDTICSTVTSLFNSYTVTNQVNEELDFSYLANFVCKMLLSSSAVNYFSDKVSKEQIDLIIDYAKGLMKLTAIQKNNNESLNNNLLGLLQISTYLDRNILSIDHLGLIKSILDNSGPWNIAFRNSVAFVLDTFLENSLPNEMLFERELKERFGGLKIYSGIYNVENFNKEPYPSSFDHQTLATYKLSTIIKNKFLISSKSPYIHSLDKFNPENLQISIGN